MLLDIAFGLFLSKIFSLSINTNYIIFFAIFSSLFPDIDFIFHYLGKKLPKNLSILGHRGIFHTPIFLIPVSPFITFLYISILQIEISYFFELVYIFLIGVFFHLIHDTFVLGRGVMWLYPFSHKRLKIFPDNGKDGYLKKKILWWDNRFDNLYNTAEADFKNPKMENKDWLKIWYLRPNLFLFTEIFFSLLFICLFFW